MDTITKPIATSPASPSQITEAKTVLTVQIDNDFYNVALTYSNANEVLFTFKEYQNVIMLVSKSVDPITLPTYEEDSKVLFVGENTQISISDQEKHLIPGTYPIRINDRIYYYKVLPQHQTEEEYDAMVEELSLNIGSYIFSDNLLKHINVHNVKNDDIVENTIFSLNKIVSQLKALSPTKNKTLIRIAQTRALMLTAVTPENNKLLGELNYLLQHIASLKAQIHRELQNLNTQIEESLDTINQVSNNLEIVRQNQSSLWTNHVKGTLAGVKVENEGYQRKREKLLKSLLQIIKSEAYIYEQVRMLEQAGCQIPRRQISCKAIKYQALYTSIRKFLQGIESFFSRKELKDTSLLFEYLGIINVFNAISASNFSVNSQLYKAEIRKLVSTGSCSISSGSTRLVFVYDKPCPLDIKDNYKGIISINSGHIRPDLVIYKYVDNTLADILVVEMKYRRAGFLYNQNYHTKVFNTILDYKQLGYVENNQLQTGKVSKVLLFYPANSQLIHMTSPLHQQICSFININMTGTLPTELISEISNFLAK